jgi:hypothetical protein
MGRATVQEVGINPASSGLSSSEPMTRFDSGGAAEMGRRHNNKLTQRNNSLMFDELLNLVDDYHILKMLFVIFST